jgi:hypothetical protein
MHSFLSFTISLYYSVKVNPPRRLRGHKDIRIVVGRPVDHSGGESSPEVDETPIVIVTAPTNIIEAVSPSPVEPAEVGTIVDPTPITEATSAAVAMPNPL